MHKKISAVLLIVVLLLSHQAGNAQHRIRPLNINDSVPDVSFGLSHYLSKVAKISDFKGKLIILDFWGVDCLACIQAMPEMERLQNEFRGKIQILLVTKDNTEMVNELKARVQIVQKTGLPMITSDTVFSKLFPYKTEPYHVWLDENGKVIQLSDGTITNENNIRDYLNGIRKQFSVKQETMDFDDSKPLWIEGNGRQIAHIKAYSYFTDHITAFGGGSGGITLDSTGRKIIGIRYLNSSVLQMIIEAYNKHAQLDYTRCILTVKNPRRLFFPTNVNETAMWADSNMYSYELKVPVEKSSKVFEMMQEDLKRYFNVVAKFEQKKVKCWVLKKTNSSELFKSKGGEKQMDSNDLGTYIKYRNASFKDVINYLNYAHPRPDYMPFVDGTGYEGGIDMEINASFKDVVAVNKELKRYGLVLKPEVRELKMLVVKDSIY